MKDISEMQLSDKDLGVWFNINGTSIQTQPQLDLAVVSLAELYGYEKMPLPILAVMHKLVHAVPEHELSGTVVASLIAQCEHAVQHLNKLAKKSGYKFSFAGEQYDELTLYKLGDLPKE